MRKIIAFNFISLDGFFEGPNKELDWHLVDTEFHEFAIDQLNEVDTILFGRVTYQMMEAHWTSSHASLTDPIITGLMYSKSKIIFSRTIDKADWENSRLIKENITEELIKMKYQVGKDMIILGSGSIICLFAELGLIDEYRIMINPVILGMGNLLFKEANEKHKLKLIKSRIFNSGNVLLFYGTLSSKLN